MRFRIAAAIVVEVNVTQSKLLSHLVALMGINIPRELI